MNEKGELFMKQAYRHGDLVLVKIDALPEGLTETKSKIMMTGSHGNDHSFDKGHLYLKNVSQFVFGYFVAEGTTLLHVDHGCKKSAEVIRTAKIKDGVYELHKQHEEKYDGMKPVID